MRIGILTRRYGYNHGSSLQAFAMVELLKELGYDAIIINYDETAGHLRWRIRPIIEHIQYKYPCFLWKKKKNYLDHRMVQERKFAFFENKYLPLTKGILRSKKDLNAVSKDFDRIVIGSDQIWSPFLFDSTYFADFVDNDEKWKIIPYAPSLGTSNADMFNDRMIQLLKTLPVLSCREERGSQILQHITNKEVPTVLDPTLMVETCVWDSLAQEVEVEALPSEYILTYFLGESVNQKILDEEKNRLSLPIVNISMFNRPNTIISDINIKDSGPLEFLYLIRNAKLILTDSFHCIIFSWIFKKCFIVFRRFKDSDLKSQNSRIDTLLKVLGGEDKLTGNMYIAGRDTFDYSRRISMEYLIRNLS